MQFSQRKTALKQTSCQMNNFPSKLHARALSLVPWRS